MWSYTETTVWLSEELKWVQWKGCLSRLQRPFFIKLCMCKWQLLCCGICCIIKRRVRDVWNLTLIKKKKTTVRSNYSQKHQKTTFLQWDMGTQSSSKEQHSGSVSVRYGWEFLDPDLENPVQSDTWAQMFNLTLHDKLWTWTLSPQRLQRCDGMIGTGRRCSIGINNEDVLLFNYV